MARSCPDGGLITGRTRDGQTVSWTYDADGWRSSLTMPDGRTTTFERDAVGRVTAVDHPLLGRAVLGRDAAGRITSAAAGGLMQTWDHRDGYVVTHTVTDTDASSRTEITRDERGRISRIDSDGRVTSYTYDEAHQLLEARTEGSVARWRYDAAGRLVSETVDGVTHEHTHDAAGQLVSTVGTDGRSVTHSYDAVGRRVGTDHGDGRALRLEWSATGWLSRITESGGDALRRTDLLVDALGELASVSSDGEETPVWWDTADRYAPGLLQAGEVPVVPVGPVTGIGEEWAAPGWRSARFTAPADPWAIPAAGGTGPGSLVVGAAGELTLPGDSALQWLGARAYDPAAHGFLSVDPLDAPLGAGWSGNPYSYAGNDPLHAVDPTGRRPLTDAELNTYIESTQGFLHAAGEWASENWEYVAAGAMVVGGAALMFVPVPGAQLVGAGLISAGVDTAIQKATTGEVNWGQVAVSGAAGMVGGGAAALAIKGGATVARSTVIAGVTEGPSAAAVPT